MKAIRLVKRQEEAFRRPIQCAVLFTCVNAAIRTRGMAGIESEFRDNGVEVFDSRLMDREAFRALFAYGGTLSALDPALVPNIKGAMINAKALATETVGRIAVRAAA